MIHTLRPPAFSLVLSLLAVGCPRERPSDVPEEPAPPSATAPPDDSAHAPPQQAAWHDVREPAQGFSCEMPGEPVPAPASSRGGVAYSVELGDTIYLIDTMAVADDGRSTNDVFAGARDGAVGRTGGLVRSERRFDLDGHPAHDLVAEVPDEGFVLRTRSVLVGDRLVSAHTVSLGEGDTALVERFLASLHVTATAE